MRTISVGIVSLLLTGAAGAQLVVGHDDPPGAANVGNAWLIDLNNPGSPTLLWSNSEVWGMTADEAGARLWVADNVTLRVWPYSNLGGNTPPTTVGTVTDSLGATLRIDGLALANGQLYGLHEFGSAAQPEGIYLINTTTFVATPALTWATAMFDFGGIDFDAATGLIYAPNDQTTPARAVFSIDVLAGPGGAITQVVAYPAGRTDIDGMAAGGGKLYLVEDEPGPTIHVYNLTTAQYEAPLTSPMTSAEVFSGGAWAPGLVTVLPGANLGVAITDPADCSVGAGGSFTYTVFVTNAGPDNATGVVAASPVPAGSTFVSSTGPTMLVGNDVVATIGALASGGNTSFDITVTPAAPGPLATMASVMGNEPDGVPGNNTASASAVVSGSAPTSAAAKGVFSTIASSPTSLVPELGGARFSSTGGIDRPFRSPDGTRFIMTADTDLATTADQVLLTGGNAGLAVVAREATTTLAEGDRVGLFDTVQGITDSGQFVFSTNTDSATTTADEVVVKFDGTNLVTIAREGNDAPALPGAETYGATSGSATIQLDNTVSFHTSLGGATTLTDSALLRSSGAALVAQEGVTIPTGQAGGATFPYETFDSGATDGLGFFPSADGVTYIASATTADATAMDRIAVVGNAVVIQENVVLPGSGFFSATDDATPINMVDMTPGGVWFAYGDNNDDIDWALRNGAVIAQTDAPIHTGAAELWDDAPYAQTFFYAFGNDAGDSIVGGTTNAADDLANAVIVLNGTQVVLRENDPVDLDNDGAFDDDTYIRTFRDDFGFLTDSGVLYVVARLRNAAGYCTGADADIGQALIRLELASCAVDLNGDGQVTIADFLEFLNLFSAGDPRAEFDGVPGITVGDFLAFLNAFSKGC